jgi:spoIIIJ-associated protein
MSQTSLDVTGKSVEEAIEKGLAQLGLPRDAVDIRVLREASRGILGIGSEEALVRLTPAAVEPAAPVTVAAAPAIPPEATTNGGEPAAFSADTADAAKQALERMLHGMGLNARVEIQRDLASDDSPTQVGARSFVLNIVGDDLGILIGRRGETLRDLEYLTRLLAAQLTGKQIKLVVDVEGYRTRRERVLNELAKRMAERVQSNRQPITLEAMPPNERRIVHIALRDHPTVMTQSIGEGDHRRVMILPKR